MFNFYIVLFQYEFESIFLAIIIIESQCLNFTKFSMQLLPRVEVRDILLMSMEK